jgi:3-hydroxyisobutyrate dehydrogenase-like beta-hydroxyacid dehydrogenase
MTTASAIKTGAIKTVGVIGAGRMGQPLIGHMARKGFTVAAYDIDTTKREAVTARGGRWVDSPSVLAQESDAILVCVGYDRELRALVSADGLLADLHRGTIVAVLSTVHPSTVKELAEIARPFGVHVVDSTVARGGKAADAGTLLAFIGGDADVVERLEPVFACFSSDIVHAGGVGAAQVTKAANNLVLWACVIANHEALALARRFGVDVDRLRAALLMSSADNFALRHWGENTMAWTEDDMEIVQAMAHEVGIGLPQAGLNRELCRTLKPKRFRLEEYGV